MTFKERKKLEEELAALARLPRTPERQARAAAIMVALGKWSPEDAKARFTC
jgi:hypothetical protein